MARLPRMDHRHKGVLPRLHRSDIPDGAGVRYLPAQQIQMKDQAVGDHFRPGKRMGGMKHMRRDQQDIVFLNSKAFKSDIIPDASLFDPGRLHFLVPVKRQLPVGIRRNAAITADRHQNISVRFFSEGSGLCFFHIRKISFVLSGQSPDAAACASPARRSTLRSVVSPF